MQRSLTTILWAVLLLASASSHAEFPPTGILDVAYRQREQGKLSDSVFVVELFCYRQGLSHNCTITTVTLNQCMDTPQGAAFYPKAQRSDTEDDGLRVMDWGKDFITLEEKLSGATLTYRFGFTTSPGPEGQRFARLTSFSGAATKASAITNSILTWELVPLKGIYSLVSLKCSALLPGVPTEDEKTALGLPR